jgi:gas vesicle protein
MSNWFVSGLIAGAVAGAAAGLIIAPKPGKVTRRYMGMRTRQTNRYLENLREKSRVYVTILRQKAGLDDSQSQEDHSNNHVGATG